MTPPFLTYQFVTIAEDAIGPADRMFHQRFRLHIHELRVLRLIDDHPGVTFTELAQQTKIERTATSRILSRLIKAGYVRRKIDEKDARHFLLSSTAKAKTLRAQADPWTREIEDLILSVLTADQRVQMAAIVTKLTDWLHTGYPAELAARYPDAAAPTKRTKKS
jgi:DNA-binding MarR family transcriptional regulator